MEQSLYDCCVIMVQLLKKLLAEEKITEDEYNRHIKLKLSYMKYFEYKQGNDSACL